MTTPSCLSGAVSIMAAAVLLAGCVTSGAQFIQQSNTTLGLGAPLTTPVVIVADTQFHESRGTASRYWSRAGDEFVDVTIRTAQQVIGAPDILMEVLSASSGPVLHLGDAMDVSCETEWQRFRGSMRLARGPAGPGSWLFTPGNHDGFLAGNLYVLDGIYKDTYWDQVCNVGRYALEDERRKLRLPKQAVVERYAGEMKIEIRDQVICSDEELPRYCAWARIDRTTPWASFVTQLTLLPQAAANSTPIYALLLDTSDFAKMPRLAGVEGHISEAQLRAAKQLLARIPGDARFFIAGHHDFKAWRPDKWTAGQLTEFQVLLTDPRFLNFVVTAHTHAGGWVEQAAPYSKILELNVGSLIDAPIYYRDLWFERATDGSVVVNSARTLMATGLSQSCSGEQLPASGEAHAVSAQQSESDRLSDAPVIVRRLGALLSAGVQFLAFWQSKHKELRPHLLVYRDLVQRAMPADAAIRYDMPMHDGTRREYVLAKTALLATLDKLGKCNDKVLCSVQEKGRLLQALERYFWDEPATPPDVRATAHRFRYCAAVLAAGQTAGPDERAGKIESRTAIHRMRLN